MKKIIYGSPPGSLGDMVATLPLINNSDLTFVTPRHSMRCDLLKENCPIIIDENYPDEVESINKYGDMAINNANKLCHTTIRFLKTFGVYNDTIDLIPELYFTQQEEGLSRAFKYLLDKPGLAFSLQNAQLEPSLEWDRWNRILGRLSYTHTLIQISKDTPPSPEIGAYYRNFSDIGSIRNTAIILKACDAFLGIDSGLMHLAVACGCPAYCVHEVAPTKTRNLKSLCDKYDFQLQKHGVYINNFRESKEINHILKYVRQKAESMDDVKRQSFCIEFDELICFMNNYVKFENYAYVESMWRNKPVNAFYYHPEEVDELVGKLMVI